MEGRILCGIGGLYSVETAEGVIECRARGIFRKDKITPLAGDIVEISKDATGGTIEKILPRRNAFVRPPVANVDCLVVVLSLVCPMPNATVVDKMLAIAEAKNAAPVLVINKIDLEDPTPWYEMYRRTGYPIFLTSAATGEGIEELREFLRGKVCAFTGNSGAGKSSLLNLLDRRLLLETGETSQKLGRGRHTTRASSLYPQESGGYFVDTPGFSSLDTDRCEWIPPEDLPYCFKEFEEYIPHCRFTGCRHMEERGCAVKEAVESGLIPSSRYENYRLMREQAEKIPAWERKQK